MSRSAKTWRRMVMRGFCFPRRERCARLVENHGTIVVQQYAVLGLIANGLCEYHTFDISPNGCQLFCVHLVINALYVLLDDGAFIEFRAHVMCGCTDQLDATFVSLFIWPCAFESRQK